MDELKYSMICNDKPDTATHYSLLSECYLRYNMDELEVYCRYSKVWKESAIVDLELAKVVRLR